MTSLSTTGQTTSTVTGPDQRPGVDAVRGARRLGRVLGIVLTATGLICWFAWLTWRVGHVAFGPVGVGVFVLEMLAFAAALVVSAGLAVARPPRRRDRRVDDRRRPLPVLLADALDVGAIVDESVVRGSIGADDTGEIAWARRGIRVLGTHRDIGRRGLCDAAWSVVAIDGLRRLLSIGMLIVVLFTGTAPFPTPSASAAAALGAGLLLVAVGHWLLSGGHVRPGSRLLWSMSSIGAGLGDGVSRSGLPIRWMATMATVVALNVAIALRGISDRWTHGLGPMSHDERVVALSLAAAFVAVGGIALARLPRPDLGFYGATRRLEEDSVRRLALGLTLAVALVGFVAGVASADPVVVMP